MLAVFNLFMLYFLLEFQLRFNILYLDYFVKDFILKCKKGVSIIGIKPELLLGLLLAKEVYRLYHEEFVITDLNGPRGGFSYHPMGYAADLRLPGLEDPRSIAIELKRALGEPWDVVLEQDHIHIEFDVRRAK